LWAGLSIVTVGSGASVEVEWRVDLVPLEDCPQVLSAGERPNLALRI
jgi:hypothetical protein